jgi:hypothetical protein
MNQTLNDPFEAVAKDKLAALTEVYRRLDVEPPEAGDRALYQRQSAGKALLTHIALLRKLLGHDRAIAGETVGDEIDADGLQAMIAAAKTPLDD